jgi:mono/diheme cytochrome c family protein
MAAAIRAVIVAVVVVVGLVAIVAAYAALTGLSARARPSRVEAALAGAVRSWAIPSEYRNRTNPLPRTEAAIRAGLDHFADHCALCHANDGSGNTSMGRNLFPPAPDMRAAGTQELTDGELFYVIEHGVRFTGMPAWGTGAAEEEELTWQLVHFIRRLPHLTVDEIQRMEERNPRSPAEIRQQIEEERFLQGN